MGRTGAVARAVLFSTLGLATACSSGKAGSSGTSGSSGTTSGSSGASTSHGSSAAASSTSGASSSHSSSTRAGASSTGTTSSSSSSGTSTLTAAASSSSSGAAGSFRFPASSIIYQDISQATADATSPAVMAAIGSWGGSGIFQIDFSMNIMYADPAAPLVPFTQSAGYYTPDCDVTPVPQLPPGGGIEGTPGYGCDASQNDCHLLIYQGHWLFEAYQASTSNGFADGGLSTSCEVAWDLTHDYWQPGTPFSRGDQCTSTDAAGMPIAPLLVTGAELQAGVVPHALRFILPNAKMQAGYFLHPGTHAGGPSGAAPLPIYASRFRLRQDFDLSTLPNAAARAVAVALQTYGMFLDDGGNIPLTFDQSAQAQIGSHDLSAIQVSDFELIDNPDPAVTLTYNCQRTPLTTTN
jgi:hypothetical protein